ncbi:DoxX [Thiorhodovibrio winogradskyi]|uniref:DoxX n=1 Tax=Thiorhodovibrio winogradskyi TaxID=77007 RepID=A0ABZ0SEY0_9GAMM|nr:DoxX family membrane protein [Thiorhodovibrio winogradskyi]
MATTLSTTSNLTPALRFADLAPHAHWLLRIGFASVFLFHGIGKLMAPTQFADMMGLALPVALAVAVAEVAGGLGLLAGAILRRDWITRLGALATVPVLIGAISMVHWGQWSFVATASHPMGGMEFQVSLLLMALYFVVRGNTDAR